MAFAVIDPSDFLAGDIFRQDEFLSSLDNHDWPSYAGKRVLVRGCQSAIIPPWAFMCFTARLAPYARTVLYGNEHDHVVVARRPESD